MILLFCPIIKIFDWYNLQRLNCLALLHIGLKGSSLAYDCSCNGSVMFLGFVLNPKLIRDEHILSICNKFSRVLKKLATDLPNNYSRQAYITFFQSDVCYGIRLWVHATNENNTSLAEEGNQNCF